ncbi:MAG: ubiquinone biosynthesis regulatory protein kinase UbiB [Proteobacteria bacterium]|nr:ubiquinone biosynthesis regulatory protein kinase UbiB [Pseudomonadota bacterium]
MTSPRALPRMWRVFAVLVRYRLDDLVDEAHALRPLQWARALLPRPRREIAAMPRGARLRLALTQLGPIYVKAGQVLSTRRDLLPPDIADELSLLQDQVPPFPGGEARAIVEAALGAPVAALYARFDETPLASASIAQVHAAALPDGREVVVKVVRPGIRAQIARDLELLHALAGLVARRHPQADKIRPQEIVEEVEKTLYHELDLQREAGNASLLRRNFTGSPDLYVPEVHWSHTNEKVLTMERVHGIPADDIAALDAAGIDRKRLAEKGVRLFYTQVFRDNFFHADAHPGNIWVDTRAKDEPRFIALDFGIMGTLPEADQYWLAENFMALFERDYRRIAQLHVAAGWIPPTARVDELEAAVRTVCEPYFTRPLSEISLAEVVAKMFNTARRFELTLQPQLILMQKTLLNIEGLGRQLDPSIDIWAVAHPELRRILARRYSPLRALREIRRRMPEWLHIAPQIPDLVHAGLQKMAQDARRVDVTSAQLQSLQAAHRDTQRRILAASFGGALLVGAALLFALAPARAPWLEAMALVVGLIAFVVAWPWRNR